MAFRIKSILSVLLAVFIFASCEKEYSVELGNAGGGTQGGTAIFTLDGAPGPCNGVQIAGSYAVGTATTAANNVNITVDVQALGTYTISTATINGVVFAATGTFANLGIQLIQLNAAGTPVAAGNFNYLPGVASCSFQISVDGGGTSNGTAVYVFNGAPNNCATPAISGDYVVGTPLNPILNQVILLAKVTTAGTYTINTTTTNGMQFTATGSFATAGPDQPVTFVGSGTPSAAISSNFLTGTAAVGCTFTIVPTNVGTGGTSAFVLEGNPNTCVTKVVAGTYKAGIPLDPNANTVTVSANVTTAGTYSVTATANGMTFTGTGTFANTGAAQPVVLRGTGTPVIAGTFNFAPGTLAQACSFPITVTAGTTTTGFLKATIGGVAYEFNTALTANYDNTSAPPGSGLGIIGTQSLPAGGTSGLAIALANVVGPITAATYGNYSSILQTKVFAGGYTDNTGNVFSFPTPPTTSPANQFSVVLTAFTATSAAGTFSGSIPKSTGPSTATSVAVTNGSFNVTF